MNRSTPSRSRPPPSRAPPSSCCTAWAPTATTSCRWPTSCPGRRGPVRYVLPHAPVMPVTINNGYRMRAWYDILGTELVRHEDEAGLRASLAAVEALIAREKERGIPAGRIVLAGFSQGCAMALLTGLRHRERLAGIVGLSGYLPLAATPPPSAPTPTRSRRSSWPTARTTTWCRSHAARPRATCCAGSATRSNGTPTRWRTRSAWKSCTTSVGLCRCSPSLRGLTLRGRLSLIFQCRPPAPLPMPSTDHDALAFLPALPLRRVGKNSQSCYLCRPPTNDWDRPHRHEQTATAP